MKAVVIYSAFIVLLTASSLRAQVSSAETLKAGYRIEASGSPRQYEVAADEISVKDATGKHTVKKIVATDLAATAREARAEQAKGTSEVALVLYESGKPRTEFTRAIVTKRIVVQLADATRAKEIAAAAGLRVAETPAYAPGLAIFEASTTEEALRVMEKLRAAEGVRSADVMLAQQKQKKVNDPLSDNQWHLRNTGSLGGAWWIDLNVNPVWDQNITGNGVTIGIVDDGLQFSHPDLQPNYSAALSYDIDDNDANPTPVDLVYDSHGTACAGLAAGRGDNHLGITGVAYQATLAGFRLIAEPTTDQQDADAFARNNNLVHIKSNSWGYADGGHTIGGPGPLAKAALVNGVATGRGGKGVIYVFAGGNGLYDQDNSNYDGFSNAIEVIAVGAVSDYGFQSYYSEPGANLVVCAPSNGGAHNEGITTTDLTGDSGANTSASGTSDLSDRNYRSHFGGTSAACPQVAGVAALMLEANPNLGWRDVKEILIRTARPVHFADADWRANSAGLLFNHKYGAGLVDAMAAVTLAQNWTNLPAEVTVQNVVGTTTAIPDNSATGVTRSFLFQSGMRVEHVEVKVNITHPTRGDLEVILTSPSGMTSRLAEQHFDDNADYANWTFSTVRHWGENAIGTWTVKIADRKSGDIGSVKSVTVVLHGANPGAVARFVGGATTLTAEGNLPANNATDPGERVTFNVGLKNVTAFGGSNVVATLLPIGGVTHPGASQNYGPLNAFDGEVQRSFSFNASGSSGTMVKAILQVSDGGTPLGYASVCIPLGKSQSNISSSAGGAILIRDFNTANPSPSSVTVSGLTGRVQNLSIALNTFTHTYPYDVGLLLQGPDSLEIQFFDGTTATSTSNQSYVLDDNAATYLPYVGPMPTGTYKPVPLNFRQMTQDPNVEFAYTLGEFNGVPANGTWNLFTQDFAAQDSGRIGGWSLNFTTVTSTDNIFFAEAASTVAENANFATVVVTRTGGREGTATVRYATSNGTALADSDYTAVGGTLTFLSGELEKTISIPILDDAIPEAPETFLVTLSNVTGNTQLGAVSVTTVTIVSDDLTPVSLSPVTQKVNEANSPVTFVISRAAAGTTGTVRFSTATGTATAGTDYTATTGTATFGIADLTTNFTVPILDDNLYELDETFTVTLSTPTDGISLGANIVSTITIHDGDSDGDSLPDDLERALGLNPLSATDGTLDSDGDGFSNTQEFIMGTDLASRASALVLNLSFTGNDVKVSFPSVVGRQYTIERRDSLTGTWTPVLSNIVGTGSSISVTDTNGALQPRRFYRAVAGIP